MVHAQVTWPSGQVFLYLAHHRLACPHDFLLIVVGLLGVLRGEEIKVGLPHGLGRVAQPELICVRQVYAGEAALPILEVDHVGEIIHQGVEEVSILHLRHSFPLVQGGVAGDAW